MSAHVSIVYHFDAFEVKKIFCTHEAFSFLGSTFANACIT